MDPVRVRFAPSPTGYLHVGGARTALFNWLFARHFGGVFVLRIEDTDFERSSEEMVAGILEAMSWLGLDWDEGPFYQSRRLDLYESTATRLLATGQAYRCFCSKEILEQRRALPQAGGSQKYEGTCRRLPQREADERQERGEPFAIRFAVPKQGSTVFDDAVFGHLEFANSEIEDFVLMRSDGVPTYHLSVVADDIDMRMTLVIRGADHISNTPKQVLLYRALGKELPVFAHVPLILGPDKTRLSKRHGATSVVAYRHEGIVPEAFRNFLALLGWSPPGAGQELMSGAEMIAAFGLDGISRSDAVFDRAKLDWFNSEYLRRYSAERLLPLIQEQWAATGLVPSCTDPLWLHAMIDLVKPRARNLGDFATVFRAYFTDDFAMDEAAVAKFLKDDATRELVAELSSRYEQLEPFNEIAAERILRDFAAEKNVKAGVLINGSRVALTGQAVAPSLFAVMMALGKEKTVERLRDARLLPAPA